MLSMIYPAKLLFNLALMMLMNKYFSLLGVNYLQRQKL
jgi:hypothetical protein